MNLADLFIMSILAGITACILLSMKKDKKEHKGCRSCCKGCRIKGESIIKERNRNG